jgi:DNA-directed RNA polymerase subunit RPC12/RpoP
LKHETELKLAGGLNHRECATVLAALRNWQLTLTNLGLSDRSSNDVAQALAKDMPSFDHFEDGTKPLTVGLIDALCERINLGPKARIGSINLDPSKPVSTTDSAILDQIDDLLVNEFGEDERSEIMPDACYELLRHIADELLDTRKHPEEIPEACVCDNTHQQQGTVCLRCWQDKVKPYTQRRGVACPFCASSNIEGRQFDVQAGTAWQPMNCTDCGREWNDVYRLDTISEIRQPEVSNGD